MDFWAEFSNNATELNDALVRGETRSVFNRINDMAQSHAIPYALDITSDDFGGLLIFSPEGDSEIGHRIDLFLQGHEVVGPWRIFGRRQPKDVRDAVAIARNLYLVDLSKAKFRIIQSIKGIEVIIYLADASNVTAEEGDALAFTFLCHILGEEQVMEKRIISTIGINAAEKTGEIYTIQNIVDRLRNHLKL